MLKFILPLQKNEWTVKHKGMIFFKNILLIYLIFINLSIFSQNIGEQFYSYPDRRVEIQINDTSILYRNVRYYRKGKKDKYYNYIRGGDTLFVIGKENGKKLLFVQKGDYIDFIRYTNKQWKKDKRLINVCSANIFRKESSTFKEEFKKIISIEHRDVRNRIFELYARIKRLEIFGKSCDEPLPKVEFIYF